MSKSLLIVESPTKAKTLERYLGKDFIVRASLGHIKDLPGNKLGIDLGHEFHPEYQVLRGKKKVIDELNKAVSKVDAIYLGPDPDREGEAIAWHIAEEIHSGNKPVYRVLFYELTRKAILEALAKPNELNRSLYEAQQARRILDRLVGYLISPILWQKVKRGLSAGRVQSVALRLICQREREVQAFRQEEYWTIDAMLSPEAEKPAAKRPEFSAQLARCKKKKCVIGSEKEAMALVEALKPLSYQIGKVEKKTRQRRPFPPFITSTLQQDAARKFHYSARQTMSIAQKLYEGIELGDEGAVGLITYMRSDCTRLSQDAVHAARDFIEQKWGKDYLPEKAVFYKPKSTAQGAHEAIRPTDAGRTPEVVARYLKGEQLKLYTLIWKRFIACQMNPAQFDQTTIDITAGDYGFRASGSVLKFPGFLALYEESADEATPEKEVLLPEVSEGQLLALLGLDPKQHFPQPPPHFTEASLIKELEELGIGRPSTYATIVSTIIDREYVLREKMRLRPTELGVIINDLLVENFSNIMDVDFTAKMEKSLDEVEKGEHASLGLLTELYGDFSKTLELADRNMCNLRITGCPTDQTCPTCGQPLRIRFARNGPFMGCSGYPACSFTSDYKRDEQG